MYQCLVVVIEHKRFRIILIFIELLKLMLEFDWLQIDKYFINIKLSLLGNMLAAEISKYLSWLKLGVLHNIGLIELLLICVRWKLKVCVLHLEFRTLFRLTRICA